MILATLYQDIISDPYGNMAFDEWLLSQAIHNPGAVYLRLYQWQKGAITFGYHQREASAIDFTKAGDTPVIRRITGGRALYHEPSDLTYAIAANPTDDQHTVPKSLHGIAGAIASALVSFLSALGVDARYDRRSAAQEIRSVLHHMTPCLESVSRYELTANGRKVAASAQKRVGSAFLQHGAVKLRPSRIHPALGGEIIQPENEFSVKPDEFAVTEREEKEEYGHESSSLSHYSAMFAAAFAREFQLSIVTEKLSEKQATAIRIRTEEIARQPMTPRTIF